MILCLDIGNTDIDAGVFENDKLLYTFQINYKKDMDTAFYVGVISEALKSNNVLSENVTDCVLCSVVSNTTDGVCNALTEIFGFKPLLFKNDEIAEINFKIGNPQEVGTDIVAACLAVKEEGNLPAIVIDMGTATTITAMDINGDILGVSIIPGVIMALQAMHSRTGLPIDVSLTPPPHAIGTDTAQSIASGSVLGSAYCMDGMINIFKEEMGTRATVYATGGISKAIMPLCKNSCIINDNLLLEGMYAYYKKAVKKGKI